MLAIVLPFSPLCNAALQRTATGVFRAPGLPGNDCFIQLVYSFSSVTGTAKWSEEDHPSKGSGCSQSVYLNASSERLPDSGRMQQGYMKHSEIITEGDAGDACCHCYRKWKEMTSNRSSR